VSSNEQRSQKKIQEIKNQVSEVSNIMQANIDKLLERGQRMEDLENKSELLSSRSGEFRVFSKRIKKKMWWEHKRLQLIISIALIIFIVVILIWVMDLLIFFER